MAVLVTGGAGFIGSHIVDLLIDNGFEVVTLDNLLTGRKKNINPQAKSYNLSLNDNLDIIFKENNIEYISHHAAQASVSFSTKNPLEDAQNNIIGTINLLQTAKKYGVKKIIAASTAAVYGTPEYLPVDEKHTTKVLSNYGLSKITMEEYIKLSGIDYIIFRYANVYGPRQDAYGEAGVVAIFIERLKSNQNIEIHGDGNQTRDFLFVKDVAQANLLAIQSDLKNAILNISTCSQTSINKLYSTISTLLKSDITPQHTIPREGDIKDSILDNKKAKQLLNWESNTNLEEGISQTI